MSTATASAAPAKKRGSGLFQGLQKVGRSLQLPIAVLPAAGILLRLGQADVFGKDGLGWDKVATVFATAGDAVFANLPLLFCIGVAIGFAKKSDGSTALAALVGFLVYQNVLQGVPGRPRRRSRPARTSPRRTTTRVSSAASSWVCCPPCSGSGSTAPSWSTGSASSTAAASSRSSWPSSAPSMGVVFGLVWEPIGNVITNFGEWMTGLGAVGAGIFGLVNRALIPIGMHQFVNTVAWFQIGDFTNSAGARRRTAT